MSATETTKLEDYLTSLGKRSTLARKTLTKRFRLTAQNDTGFEVLTYAAAIERFVGQGYSPDYHQRRWTSTDEGDWWFEDFGKECLNYYHFLTNTKPPAVAKIKSAKRKPSFVVKTMTGPDCARDFMPPKKPAELTEALYLAVVAKWGKGTRTEVQSFACWKREGCLNIYSKSKGRTMLKVDGGLLRCSTEGAWGKEEVSYYEVS